MTQNSPHSQDGGQNLLEALSLCMIVSSSTTLTAAATETINHELEGKEELFRRTEWQTQRIKRDLDNCWSTMNWEAANAPGARRKRKAHNDNEGESAQGNESSGRIREKKSRRATETVEACLSRLSKAYSTSISCIGEMRRSNNVLQKEAALPEMGIDILNRVANAARSTLESAILLDPLIAAHAPTLKAVMEGFANNASLEEYSDTEISRWNFVTEKRPVPPVLSSSAHKATVRELAYLSLVNYADLLVSCCPCSPSTTSTEMIINHESSILRTGVVPTLTVLDAKRHCCWKKEVLEDTQRLALTALCDASNLDGSDPSLWLKLACSARAVERAQKFQDTEAQLQTTKQKYRRLQRYALERGCSCLPPHVPPNRTAMRALKELSAEVLQEAYPAIVAPLPEKVELRLEIPRYSWSALGRMLVRACREGMDYQGGLTAPRSAGSSTFSQYGSPTILMELSPMLALPTRVLGYICRFLESSDVWKFEATCRALTVSLVAARASLEEERVATSRCRFDENDEGSRQQNQDVSRTMLAVNNDEKVPSSVNNAFAQRRVSGSQRPEEATAHRTSKRLLSQLITSGKIAERKFRRSSVEYCFLAAALSTTKEEHRMITKRYLERAAAQLKSFESRRRNASQNAPSDSSERHRKEAVERLCSSSLSAFVERWSGNNSGPMDLLQRFLGHVAMNVDDVFSSDPGGPMVLISCLFGCFEIYSRRGGLYDSLLCQRFKGLAATGSVLQILELFAIDLLHAELLLRQCDRYAPDCVEFDDDSNQISLLVASLLNSQSEIDAAVTKIGCGGNMIGHDLAELWTISQVRCYWMVAGFFLWRSRISRIISEAREAEQEGVWYLDRAAECFNRLAPTVVIRTPHLSSPGRSESHWRSISVASLKKFRDEIQASSVVSLARQKFQDVLAELNRGRQLEQDCDFSETDAISLVAIGESLFERYKAPFGDKEAKHFELVEDFLALHRDELEQVARLELGAESAAKLRRSVPSCFLKKEELIAMTNPSILSILLACLNTKVENQLRVVELLARVILTTHEHQNKIWERMANAKIAKREDASGGQSDDSASDDESLQGDGGSVGRRSTPKYADERIARQCGCLIHFLIERLSDYFFNRLSEDEKTLFVSSNDCFLVVSSALASSEGWFHNTPRTTHDDDLDLVIFKSTQALVRSLRSAISAEKIFDIERVYVTGMMKAIISHRQILESIVTNQGNRAGRSVRQRLCLKRAAYIGSVTGEVGCVLSHHLVKVLGNKITKPGLLQFSTGAIGRAGSGESTGFSAPDFSFFCDSILWLHKYSSQADSESSASAQDATTCSAFDRPIIRELRIPVISAVVGLCGAATCTRPQLSANAGGPHDQLSLSEFFDSDVSANDFESDDEGADRPEHEHSRKEMLRTICHAIHCVNLALKRVDEKGAMSHDIETQFGPLLPLVSVRVLNNFADMLLLEFGNEEDSSETRRRLLWSEEYPDGTRTTGELLDSTLHKCYRLLYGFSIVGEKDHLAAGKDPGATTAVELTAKHFVPESTAAAAQLYRCIVRAYAGGRRSPPKAALEVVSSALPPMEETLKSKSLRNFLFKTENHFGLSLVSELVAKGPDWASPFARIHSYLQMGKREGSGIAIENDATQYDEVILVRRGISSQLARGPMPVVTGDSGKSKSDSGANDERSSSARNEEEMSKKFNVILDDLCLGEVNNSEGWYRASQCLVMKADLIADRLGLSKGFARSDNFAVPEHRRKNDPSLSAVDLETFHGREKQTQERGWLPFFGDDLSLFVNHSWSSFSSLKEFSQELSSQGTADEDEEECNYPVGARYCQVWRELDELFAGGDFVKWQRAWGGLFVSALRQLAVRFLCVALYVVHCEDEEDVLVSEICETMGLLFYSQMLASQTYGYPMRVMTDHDKHGLAVAAKECFTCAVKSLDTGGKGGGSVARATWDLLFMIGKCHEKIAGTFRREAFPVKTTGKCSEPPRQYEKHMEDAFQNYAKSLKEAKTIEDDGGLLVEQQGGSAHGSSEVLYRIHASRLKCLISAISRDQDEIRVAEAEALRLTERHWFKEPSEKMREDIDIRDRVWDVVSDIVAALAQCRLDHQFFHRSVYRHAQALMWAPVLCDPIEGRAEGSLGTVPATRSYRLRGMNNSTNAASSAVVVMNSLFDKKRPQLCAVWVTTTAVSSPFQNLNTSIRKYDSIRGKYISAYIESLRLCRRHSDLETLLKWFASSRRDLPSIFQSTVLPGGRTSSRKSNSQDCLLADASSLGSMNLFPSIKRLANSAIASIILQDLRESNQASDTTKSAEAHLRDAYACFLRLNCNTDDLMKRREWKYGENPIPEVAALCQAYLALGDEKTQSSNSNWSGGDHKTVVLTAAVEKCRILFPSVSGSLFSKKASSKSKCTELSMPKPSRGSKREAGAMVASDNMVSFEVRVPGHLSAGSTFLSTVNIGGNTKKVKLTVPEGNPSTLRFALRVTSGEAPKET